MRAVVQRVREASVSADGVMLTEIGAGLLVLLGVGSCDREKDADWMAAKLAGLRLFENSEGKFDRCVTDVGGSVLVISQFTLYADTRKGRRPSFSEAASPDAAEPLYRRVVDQIEALGVPVSTGRFGAHMQVSSVNDGPVTVVIDAGPSSAP